MINQLKKHAIIKKTQFKSQMYFFLQQDGLIFVA